MAKRYANRLVFRTTKNIKVSVCLDNIYKAEEEIRLFEHGSDNEPWIIHADDLEYVDEILFGETN